MKLELRLGYDEPETVRALFQEYTDMLVREDPTIARYLQQQNYQAELIHLEAKYGLPDGRLYLAWLDDQPAGCAALRPMDQGCCELKRLYVRPQFRGHGLGRKLADQIIADAREIGYSHMLLDTLSFLKDAIALYPKLGFYEVERYNNSPMENAVYMRRDLNRQP
ncbi:MAG: GNAT family N-acetyltransferase [Lawsonibacter sp.]|nr:GNAT family N-acetyltransferase [Lawsonibacter sp.]